MAKITMINILSVFQMAMLIAVAAAGEGGNGNSKPESVNSICESTDYKQACEKSLKSTNSSDPKELIRAGFQATIEEIKRAIANSDTVKELAKDPMSKQALDICKEVMQDAIDDLQKSFNEVGAFDVKKLNQYIENLKVWLGGAVAYEQTCLDAFLNTTGDAGQKMREVLNSTMELTSNALAMVSKLSSITDGIDLESMDKALDKVLDFANGGHHRKLLSEDGFPSWVTAGQRMILQAKPAATLVANVVVAQDGSGKFKTINEALKEVPLKSNNTFVIHIKAGVYKEQVIVDKGMNNVVFIGDGPTKTKVTGSLNFIDGTGTFKTATVAVIGERFMAKDMAFENSAGAIKHQAVALRVQSDQSIFYNCQMDGYQDTLYAHSHRQFYRDCTVSGTIDFVFGDSLAVLQNCKFIVRKPLENQGCMVTAQGRKEERELSALVLQNCSIVGDPAFVPTPKNKAFLGRPWQLFSRTIIMHTFIDKIIDPTGWCEWQGNFGLDTLYYAEFENKGPGADVSQRVKWKGIHTINKADAEGYTAGKFLQGDDWVPRAGIPYASGM